MAGRKGSFRIEISREFDDWTRSFDQADDLTAQQAVWAAATDVLFDATQQVVHVVTGNLKASGSSSTMIAGPLVVGVIEYDADYAMDEIMRGGTHDFMQRGLEQVEGLFQGALLVAVSKQFGGV